MEYSKLIHDFFDGTLDAQQENELFMMVSSNDEVRAEFKHTLSLDKALNKKLSSFAPSAKSTVGLFSQLGFTAPAAISGGPKPPGVVKSTLKKYSQGLVGAASMAVVSVIVFLLLDTGAENFGIRNNSIAENSTANNKIANNKIEIAQTPTKDDIPVVESYRVEQNDYSNASNENNGNEQNDYSNASNENNGNEKSSKNINSKPASAMNTIKNMNNLNINHKINNHKINNHKINNHKINNNLTINRQRMDTEKQASNIIREKTREKNSEAETYNLAYGISKSDVAANLTAPGLNPVVNTNSLGFVSVIDAPRYDNYVAPSGLSLSIHGNQYWQLNSNSVPESTVPKFNNMGLTMLYDVSEDWSIGFDLRQEHFYQEFTVAGDNGIDYLYQQTPNYITYSGVVKYDFYEFDYVSLFAQSMAGMTATGGIGRLMAGAEYSPNNAYSFLIGMEYSVLAFKDINSPKYYFAPKLGFNYSVIIKL